VLGTALFDRPAFRTAMSHGIVLAPTPQDEQVLRNYPDVTESSTATARTRCAVLMASPILRGGNLV